MRSIPLSISKERLKKAGIPADFEVRGELLMPTAAFKKVNEEREKRGLPTFANPRNFTAGTVRQLDANVTAERRMDFFPYILLQNGRTYFDRHWKTLDALQAAGFKVNQNRKLVHSMDEVWAFIQEWEGKRDSLPYEIDGIVVKVDRTGLQAELGFTGEGSAVGDCLQICSARWNHESLRMCAGRWAEPGSLLPWRVWPRFRLAARPFAMRRCTTWTRSSGLA